jgi:hypothetical protein
VGALELLNPSEVFLQIFFLHGINEEYALEVIDFMKNTTGEQSIRFKGMAITFYILKLAAYGFGS